MSNNTQELSLWCEQQLQQPLKLEALSGDASFRRYFRVLTEGADSIAYIAVFAPPEKEKNHEFVAIAKALAEAGVAVPEVIAADFERGFMLQQDLGDQLLLPLLDAKSVDEWYGKAMRLIVQMQSVPCGRIDEFPNYDEQLLRQELELFPQWFISELLDVYLTEIERDTLDRLFDELVISAERQLQVFVHRDFHARNIMVADGELLTIDFQDAVKGPATYDVVSLLRDCYYRWDDERVYQWLEQFREMLLAENVMADELKTTEAFRRAFDLMGLQRHIKVLGIFARLFLRDGKTAYLADLPRVITYTLDVAKKYAEFAEFVVFFEQRLMPIIAQHDWWKNRVIESWG